MAQPRAICKSSAGKVFQNLNFPLPIDQGGIQSHIGQLPLGFVFNEFGGGLINAVDLPGGYMFRRRRMGAAVFYFDKDDLVAVAGNQINFPRQRRATITLPARS